MKSKSIGQGLCLLAVLATYSASGQLDLSTYGDAYLETFDSLSNGLPAGWEVHVGCSASAVGTVSPFETNKTSWTSTTGQFANYASVLSNWGTNFTGTEASGVQGGCTNRALAVRQKSTGGFDPGAGFVLRLLNTAGRSGFEMKLDCVTLCTNARATTWTVDYGLGAAPSEFIPLATVEDPRLFGATNIIVPFGSALDDRLEPVWIRVVALSLTTPASGSRETFGIDNVSLTWTGGSSPVVRPIPLNIQMIGDVATLSWTNAAFQLQCAPGMSEVFTNVSGAVSPHVINASESQMYFRLFCPDGRTP